jgi:homogentisate 1,2-dioxygenase
MEKENYKSSGTFSKQAHVKIPTGLYEEEHGRNGFFGKVSHLYHQQQPTDWINIEGDLKPRCLPPLFKNSISENQFEKILFNQDVEISLAVFRHKFDNFFRNADFDELYFFHAGEGKIETTYGHLSYRAGDYVILPRGTTYKLFTSTPTFIFKIESASEFEQPHRGLLGPNALYDQTVIETPEAQLGSEPSLKENKEYKEHKVQIKRLGKLTITYPFNPLDVAGWKGSVYPMKLSIYDICPINSHRYHIPPSGHTTFVCKNFVVCSFVARPLEDSKEGVLKVPFYHSNIDFDEVLFYHAGNFFSRDNIAQGALTFHPQGIHHGPHPKAFKNADEKLFTDEFAVMVDTKRPLNATPFFLEKEDKDYWKSWMKK